VNGKTHGWPAAGPLDVVHVVLLLAVVVLVVVVVELWEAELLEVEDLLEEAMEVCVDNADSKMLRCAQK